MQENDDVEEQGLNKTVNNVTNSQETISIISCYKEIIKIKNKKAIGCIGKHEELLKKFTNNENVLKKLLCLKNPPYNQVILKIILRLLRLFEKKIQLFFINNWNFVDRKILKNIFK